MRNVRELVGSLTQARVQLMAALSILESEENEATDDDDRREFALNAQKVSRNLGVIEDVRDFVDGKLRGPQQRPCEDATEPDGGGS